MGREMSEFTLSDTGPTKTINMVRHFSRFKEQKLSAVAQWKRAGLITLMSSDRNRAALCLIFCSFFSIFHDI